MTKIKTIFEELQATSSKTGKEAILRANADNHELRETLNFLLNPFITTGLSDKKINKQLFNVINNNYNPISAKDVMDYLKKNNTGTDVDICVVQRFLSYQPSNMVEFYKGLFTKSIKLGCAANTINKVFGKGFIPQFEVMLADKYFDHADKIEGKDFSLTLKLDGIRTIVIKRGNKINLFSRQGQPIEGLLDIERELLKLSNRDFVLDGELLISDTAGLPSKEQYKQTIKIVRRDGEKFGITFRAFDYLEYEEFANQKGINPYINRRRVLESTFSGMRHTEILPTLYSGNDISQISLLLDKVRDDEEEGLMLNINDAPYEFKRTRNLLKVKVMENCDLMIIGFEEGQGRLSGTLGRLNVDYKGNILGVGSGFTDAQREWIWKNQDRLAGRVVSVSYFEETRNKDGNLSLRFPVFKELREIGKLVNI